MWRYQNACTFPGGPVVAGDPQSIADRDRRKNQMFVHSGMVRTMKGGWWGTGRPLQVAHRLVYWSNTRILISVLCGKVPLLCIYAQSASPPCPDVDYVSSCLCTALLRTWALVWSIVSVEILFRYISDFYHSCTMVLSALLHTTDTWIWHFPWIEGE